MSEERSFRDQRLTEFFRDIESQILLTDDEYDLMLLGTLFITTGKNILVNIKGPRATRDLFDNLDLNSGT